ncbi:hypothetical protein DL764_007568 [Monosporascus ibericus]|uniref:Uncharacterized protein n=1 Tax=Monosporascus ibericus TaxID=155417 RepID=A0A4Q4SZT5_9PEZI|nr:hypothetical protein DL764_007568 [Monosporascus ibericus]
MAAAFSVTLREPEYFSGLVFPPTNRVSSFGPAMKLRVHLALTCNPPGVDTRRRIRTQYLSTARGAETKIDRDSAVSSLVRVWLNGREIASALTMAKTTARSEGKPLRLGHIEIALEVCDLFEKELHHR